jgi:Flp pilus assembly protein CpaB
VTMSASSPPTPAAPGSAAASKIFLVVAVMLGVLATLLAFFFINSAGASNTGPQVWIVVAKHDMSPNLPIDPDRDLMRLPVPARFSSLAARCLDWEARTTYKGVRINREIFAGQPILLGDIVDTDYLILEKPYFALTLPAETGMIIPGDYVKIILTRTNMVNVASSMPVAGAPAYDAVIIGKDEGFKVLAVGSYLFKTRQQTLFVDQSSSVANAANKTVTLQVTETQAKEIMSALGSLSSSNKATLLLCPSAKTAPPETPAAEPAVPAATAASRPATGPRL